MILLSTILVLKVTFENGQEPVLVRLYDAGKGWGIVSIEDVEED